MGTIASVAIHYYGLTRSPRRRLREDSFDIFEPRKKYAQANNTMPVQCDSPLLI